MEDVCNKSKDYEETLHDWLDYLEHNLKIILVITPDDSNAFIIFETLNDRGLELAISDLLKNYLFKCSLDRIEETKNRWMSMIAILENASEDPIIVTYLRHFAMSRYGLIREKELFGQLKKRISTKTAAINFSTELLNYAKTYSALINTEHDYWDNFDNQVKESVITLNLLGIVQIRPLLLAIIDKFEKKAVKLAFRKLVSIAIRLQTAGGDISRGALERIYADVAKSVADKKISTSQEIIDVFKDKGLPSDADFELHFSRLSMSKSSLARYYLRSLEIGLADPNSETTPHSDPTKVNLEHILPLTPNPDWEKHFTKEEIKAYQRRLGNLAIMATKINGAIGNGPFSQKKDQYKSTFYFTNLLTSLNEWNKEAIETRQLEMAKLAVKIWSV